MPAKERRVSFGGEKTFLNLAVAVVAQLRIYEKPLNWIL